MTIRPRLGLAAGILGIIGTLATGTFAAYASGVSAPPVSHPITALPDFQCSGTEADCFTKATSVLGQSSFVPLDLQHAPHPDLNGVSEYWGHSEAHLVGHAAPYVAVLMHGIYEDGRQLAPEAALMSEYGIPVLNTVLAGHGDTNEFANDLVYQDWIEEAERALRLAKALGGRAILIGHSTGGVLSAYLALKHPDEVAALVLIEPAIRVTRTVTTAACVSQHGIANIADYPELLKLDGTDPASLHNRVISPSAGCQVHFLRKAMLSLLPHAREEEVALSTPGSNPIADPAQEKRWTSNELKNSQAMGELLHAPLLFMINRHDLVVDYDNNRAFLRGASQNVNVRSYIFNQDWKMRHGSITFEGVELILPQLRSFINSVIGSGARSESY